MSNNEVYTPDNATWQKDAAIIEGSSVIATSKEIPISAMPPKVEAYDYNGKELKLEAQGCLTMFLKNEPIKFNLFAPACDNKIKYRVRNTLNGDTFKGEIAINRQSGMFELDFTQSKLKAGHYRLSVYVKGNTLHTYFAVLQKNSRKYDDTPFAVDHASAWHVDAEKREQYAYLLKCMGVSWVRERIRLKDVYSPSGYDFSNYDQAFACLKKYGLKISVTFHDYPQSLCTVGWMGDSLSTVRRIARDISAHFDGVVDAWEIWNEQDVTHFTGGTPDEFAAFTKAFAIGIEDSGAKCIRALGAYARVPDHSDYGRCMLNNGIMDYVQIYNFHTYVFPAKNAAPSLDVSATKKHMDNCRSNQNKAAWLTETGAIITRPEDQGTLLKNYQCARYSAVTAALAAYYGVDKTFHFMLPGYYEGGVGFGMMSDQETLLPEYTAISALCNNLGKGVALGKTTLDVEGIAFDSGEDQVLMLWSDQPKAVTLPAILPTVVVDMNGKEQCLVPEGDVISLIIGAAPQYIHYNKIPKMLYQNDATEVKKVKPEQIKTTDRMLVKAVFPRDNFPYFPNPHKGEGEVLSGGYKLKKGDTTLTIRCCNFTDEDKYVRLLAKGNGSKLTVKQDFLLKAGEEAELDAIITFEKDGDMYLCLEADATECSKAYFTLQELV